MYLQVQTRRLAVFQRLLQVKALNGLVHGHCSIRKVKMFSWRLLNRPGSHCIIVLLLNINLECNVFCHIFCLWGEQKNKTVLTVSCCVKQYLEKTNKNQHNGNSCWPFYFHEENMRVGEDLSYLVLNVSQPSECFSCSAFWCFNSFWNIHSCV